MKQNLHKASERGSQIDNLNETTRNLDKNSALFKRGARDLRLEMAWKNNKMRCWIALVIVVIILVVVVPIGMSLKPHSLCLYTADEVHCSCTFQEMRDSHKWFDQAVEIM